MKLLIDLGNSRLKWATGLRPETIETGSPIDHNRISVLNLTGLWQHLARPERVLIATVASNHLLKLIVAAVHQLWPGIDTHVVKSQRHAHGVTSAYAQPEKLGVDRWLGMIAAFHQHQKAFCLAGCGTAITIDIVAASGQHLGGLIAPGLKLMQQALADGTENLPQIDDNYPAGLASNTTSAIYNGTLFAACGLIERVLNLQSARIDLILTGGNAELIANNLLKPALIESDMVLRGLALISPEPQ